MGRYVHHLANILRSDQVVHLRNEVRTHDLGELLHTYWLSYCLGSSCITRVSIELKGRSHLARQDFGDESFVERLDRRRTLLSFRPAKALFASLHR